MHKRFSAGFERARLSLVAGVLATAGFAGTAGAAPSAVLSTPDVQVSRAVVSQRLSDIIGRPDNNKEVERDIGRLPPKPELFQSPLKPAPGSDAAANGPTGVFGPLVPATVGLNFAGLGQGDYGFNVNSAPPDTVGAVGATQFVQWVNTSLVIFNKSTGAKVMGPISGNQIFQPLGGRCASTNDGDPVVNYDKAANRWVLTQFVVDKPYLQCVAVSQTSDATGAYNLYAFTLPQFGDYPKLSVWPDAYYISFNVFSKSFAFVGGRACAYDRAKMLTGAAATQVCFQLSSSFGGLLPSDLDGSTQPPSGLPNYFIAFDVNRLDVWQFHVDFATPANSTFTGPVSISVPAFTTACGSARNCIPQPGTGNKLDALADRLMYRLAYRNISGTQSLVLNHSVRVGNKTKSPTGVRWYELRLNGTTPSLFQSGTYSPDKAHRWMGSVAMDKVGNIGLGYSVSSSTINPSIRFSGRAPGDPLGTLSTEQTIITGSGSQTGTLTRWGDYSTLSIDPADDCTFWYTQEYAAANGTFNWKTRIASFKFNSCS